MKLAGKTAVVTGGANGIGRGIVRCLAEEGADVAVADLDLERAQAIVEELSTMGRRGLAFAVDVRRAEQIEAMVRGTLERLGPIDILVNDAGMGAKRRGLPFTNLEADDWDDCYDVNVKGVFLVCKAVVPSMKERRAGKIVNIASIAGRQGVESIPQYAASKAATINFTQALAKELARYNINVNAICPGLVWTPMWERLEGVFRGGDTGAPAQDREIFERTVSRSVPLGREQAPEDIGRLAVFLCCEDARNITGQAINVDGGQMLN